MSGRSQPSERREGHGVLTLLVIAILGGLVGGAYSQRCEYGYCQTELTVVISETPEWSEIAGAWYVSMRLENVGNSPAVDCVIPTAQSEVQFRLNASATREESVLLHPVTSDGQPASDETTELARLMVLCDNVRYDKIEFVGVTDL